MVRRHMHLLINALSSTNLSGRQVLCGHVTQLCKFFTLKDRITLLLHNGNLDVLDGLAAELGGTVPGVVVVHRAPDQTTHWLGRTLYERSCLPRLIKQLKADLYLSMSGGYVPGLPCPQYTLALNPWAMVPTGSRSIPDRVRAHLQRRMYRQAVCHADGIGYGSEHMQQLYETNAGAQARSSAIVYPALSRIEAGTLDVWAEKSLPRDPHTLLCVSLMTRHKNIGSLCRVLQLLRERYRIPARLRLIGGWADPAYRHEVEQQIEALGLREAVAIEGHVSRNSLYAAYATSRIYVLLSRSESFGIPSIEAQRVGTPVIAANGSAAPEVCGTGGRYVDADDIETAARLCAEWMQDDAAWRTFSAAARENALRFEYERTSQPLLVMLGITTEWAQS